MGKLSGKNVLISGATGFVGSNLVRRSLQEGADIHVITRDSSDKWRLNDILTNIKEYNVDLNNYRKLNRIIQAVEPSIIFHLATYGGDPSQKDTREIIESNLMGTVNLVKASEKVGFDMMVNTSSSSEYGIKSKPMEEKDLLEPVNDYGVSKAAATLYCQAIAKNEDLNIVTLRLFSPYGYYEGKNRLIPSTILSCLKGENPKVSSQRHVRDFVFIEDVLDSYMDIIEQSNLFGDIFNIGSGNQHSVGDVVKCVADLTEDLTGNKIIPEWGSAPKWSNEPYRWEANISKAKNTLNWAPIHNLKDGLTKTVEWFALNSSLYC